VVLKLVSTDSQAIAKTIGGTPDGLCVRALICASNPNSPPPPRSIIVAVVLKLVSTDSQAIAKTIGGTPDGLCVRALRIRQTILRLAA
jgi:hypothetical protein